jgi:succinate-acetate transporter protein
MLKDIMLMIGIAALAVGFIAVASVNLILACGIACIIIGSFAIYIAAGVD